MQVLYDELVDWYVLLDPAEEHRDEARAYKEQFENAVVGSASTLLELGSGAGGNAAHLKEHFRCTLTDISEPMLGVSQALNPGSEHLVGDMRTMRLARTFDAVLVHDSITYMTTEEDLRAALETAFVHTRPGGAAIVAPDEFTETFADRTLLYEGTDGARSIRSLEWGWDPDPTDTCCRSDYAILLREGTQMRSVYDSHDFGLFPKSTWMRVLRDVGFDVETFQREVSPEYADQVFLCRRKTGV